MEPLSTMTQQPFSFKLPIERFDLNLLPPLARNIGTDAFKDAVIAYFVGQYADKGGTTVVTVDDQQISVQTFELGSSPLDFAVGMLKAGQIKEAIPFLESMAKTDVSNVQLLFNLGIAYSELGQYDEAIIRLKKAVQINPLHAHAWTGIGIAYQRMGKSEQAVEPMAKAVEAEPSDGYSRRNLGAMLLGLGRTEEAIKHLREARKALPHDPQTIFGLATALEEAGGDSELAEADELYTVVIQRWPASEAAEQSRKTRTKLSHKTLRETAPSGLRMDAVLYITDALKMFAKEGPQRRQQIALEIALKGQSGLDINDPEPKYTLKTLSGKFSGLHLVSIMYAAFRQMDPTMDAGVDLSAEFQAASTAFK
jgi:tetratricopeptide (TPR) repeat protein